MRIEMSDDDLDDCDNGIDGGRGDTIGDHLDAEFTRSCTVVSRFSMDSFLARSVSPILSERFLLVKAHASISSLQEEAKRASTFDGWC